MLPYAQRDNSKKFRNLERRRIEAQIARDEEETKDLRRRNSKFWRWVKSISYFLVTIPTVWFFVTQIWLPIHEIKNIELQAENTRTKRDLDKKEREFEFQIASQKTKYQSEVDLLQRRNATLVSSNRVLVRGSKKLATGQALTQAERDEFKRVYDELLKTAESLEQQRKSIVVEKRNVATAYLQDITSGGTPIAFITNPKGNGNKNLKIIHDGITPPAGSSNPNEQYDTYTEGNSRLVDWIGYTYSSMQSFASLVFQEGIHSSRGGFFAKPPLVEVRIGSQWNEVQGLVIIPAYGAGLSENFAIYTLSFNSISGDGIRLTGVPGGAARYISVAELRVMGSATSSVPLDTRPRDFDLLRNYPNPFNPSTTIEFTVSEESNVEITIYDILGRRIRTLLNTKMLPGKYPITWDGRDENGKLVSSGVYLYKFVAGDFIATRKMTLSK